VRAARPRRDARARRRRLARGRFPRAPRRGRRLQPLRRDPGRRARRRAVLSREDAPPLVSVIMPMHDAAAFVGAAIRSVQAQTVQEWELLVVDASSRDDSHAVAERAAAADPRVRVLRNEGPGGAGPTRNVGIEAARGRYIAFLDSDEDRKSTRLNSSHVKISYAVFCLKKKTK